MFPLWRWSLEACSGCVTCHLLYFTFWKNKRLCFHRTALSERSEDLVFLRSLKSYSFDSALTEFLIFCDLSVQVIAIFLFQLCALHLKEKNLPFAPLRVVGVWRKSWNLEAENIQELWDRLAAVASLNCWIISATRGECVCCLMCAKIKFWAVRDAASCCYCHLTEYCYLLDKKSILGSPRARINHFCWQNMLRQAFLNNNIFMVFLEGGSCRKKLPRVIFSSCFTEFLFWAEKCLELLCFNWKTKLLCYQSCQVTAP